MPERAREPHRELFEPDPVTRRNRSAHAAETRRDAQRRQLTTSTRSDADFERTLMRLAEATAGARIDAPRAVRRDSAERFEQDLIALMRETRESEDRIRRRVEAHWEGKLAEPRKQIAALKSLLARLAAGDLSAMREHGFDHPETFKFVLRSQIDEYQDFEDELLLQRSRDPALRISANEPDPAAVPASQRNVVKRVRSESPERPSTMHTASAASIAKRRENLEAEADIADEILVAEEKRTQAYDAVFSAMSDLPRGMQTSDRLQEAVSYRDRLGAYLDGQYRRRSQAFARLSAWEQHVLDIGYECPDSRQVVSDTLNQVRVRHHAAVHRAGPSRGPRADAQSAEAAYFSLFVQRLEMHLRQKDAELTPAARE